jgi:Ca2+:H+ antiporter
VASGAVSDWFVTALTPATRTLGISPMFTGLVIVALASNAVENAAGIRFAWKARPDYAISTILNSPLQITLLLTPVLVLVSPLIGPAHLTLVFPPSWSSRSPWPCWWSPSWCTTASTLGSKAWR